MVVGKSYLYLILGLIKRQYVIENNTRRENFTKGKNIEAFTQL